MKFPVDLLADVSHAEMEHSALSYMNNLLYSNPDSAEQLTLPDSTQVTINISNAGFVPLYGSWDKKKILGLFSPSDSSTAVALYLLDQWWPVDDILKTADPSREGALEVETLGERIVLYVLNRIIYRVREMSSEELPFLCHGENDHAKILWKNGEAVGFYSVKPSGSPHNSFSTRSYQLPVMDSIFVRKCQRGKGFGLQMLEDFVLSFKDESLGLRYPITESMYRVCKQYLCQNPGLTNLLWEVESIGGPKQRTNIASKIQAMDLSSVSKSLSFTEESLVNTEVTQKDVVMETIITPTKEAQSMEYTVEIVEEVTVLRATREAELPVRGRSSGSKRQILVEKITEDKSEKVIRIEDIEAETPSDEHVSTQQTDMHDVSESVQTEAMFTVAPENNTEDVVDTALREKATMTSDKQNIALASQELKEPDITSAPMMEEPDVEDDATEGLENISHASQITVENVASEIEEAEEEFQRDNTAVPVVSDLVSGEAETLDKVGEVNQIEITDEKSEERVTQHDTNISTHATSKDGEAGNIEIADVKAIKTVQSETPKRRSQQYRKPGKGLKEESSAQDGERVLRGRTVVSTGTPKRKYTRHNQTACEDLEKEVDEVAEESVSATAVVEELAITEGEEPEESITIQEDVVAVEDLREEGMQQTLEDEQVTNEEETEEHEESAVEDSALKGSSAEPPATAETVFTKESGNEKLTDESEKEQSAEDVETTVIQDKQEVYEDETEEPPVVHRSVKGRHKVIPKSTEQSKIHQKPVEEHTAETDLGVGGSASEEKAEEKVTDQQMVVDHKVEQEETVDKIQAVISTEELTVGDKGTTPEEAAYDIIPSTEETGGETQNVSVIDTDRVTADMTESDSVAAGIERDVPDEVLDSALPVVEEPQENYSDPEISKLQKATVVLVDLKTTCHHLSVKEMGETSANEEFADNISSYVTEKQTTEQEMLVLEEEGGEEQENNTETIVDAAVEAEAATKEELGEGTSDKEKEEFANGDGEKSGAEEAPFIETRVLRSGKKTSYQQHKDDNTGEVITNEKVDEAETVTVEIEAERPPAVSEICVDTEVDIPVVDDGEENLSLAEADETMTMEEEEAPVITRVLRSGTKTATGIKRHKTTISRKEVEEQDTGSSEEEEPAARTLRSGRISASATPQRKPRRTRRKILEEEQKQTVGRSKGVEETGENEGAPVDKPEEDFAEKSAEADEPPAEPRILKRGRKPVYTDSKQLQIEEQEPKELVEEAEDEEQKETDLGLPRMSTTDKGDKGKAPEEDEVEVEREEPVTVETEKGLSEDRLLTKAVVQGETITPLTQPTSNSVINTPIEEETTVSAEEQPSEQMVPELSDLQKVTVVLVDLNKIHSEVHETTADAEEGVPEEKTHEVLVVEEEVSGEKVEETVIIQDVAEEGQLTSTSDMVEATASEKETLSTAEDDKENNISEKEEAPVRKGRRSAATTMRCKAKRAHTQCETEEEDKAAPTEEMQIEETDAALKEAKEIENTRNEDIEEKNEEESAAHKNEKTEPAIEMERAEAVAEESLTKLAEEDRPAETVADGREETPDGKSADETLYNNNRNVTDEEEAPVVTRVLRSGAKAIHSTPRYKNQEENEQKETMVEKSSDTDDPALETRALRKGRRAAPATPRYKSKSTRTQCQPEEEGNETRHAEETDGEKDESRQELLGDKAEEEGKSMEREVNKDEEHGENVAEAELPTGEAEHMQDAPTERAEGIQKQDNIKEALVETDTEMIKAGETKLDVEEQTTATDTGSDTAVAEAEAPVADECVVTEEDPPAVTTRTLRSKTKTSHATPSRRSRRQKDQGEDHEERQVAIQSDSPENEEEHAEGDETSPSGQETGLPAQDTAEDEAKETADVIDNRADEPVEPTGEDQEETESPKDNITVDCPGVEGRSLRKRMKHVGDEEENKAEETQFPNRRSIRKRPRVDYSENIEEDEGSEAEASTDQEEDNRVECDKVKDNKKAERSADEPQLEETSKEETSENNMEAGTCEQAKVINIVLDTDDEASELGEEDEEDDNMSEEENEAIIIGKKVLRNRSIPLIILTPQSKTRRHGMVKKSEEPLSDEKKSPQSSTRRSLRKRKSPVITPTHKSKHRSRV